MERVEELLREEFQRADPAAPTSRDEMLARVARVRRRRNAATAGLATVAVGVAAAAVAVGLNGATGQSAGAGGDIPQYTGEVTNVIFTDASHGYALQEYCSLRLPAQEVPSDAPTPDVHRQCRTQLLVTSDGGQSWAERALPADPATKDAGVDIVLGHSLMFWVVQPGTLALGGWDRKYWTTTDGGVTWQPSSTPRDVGPAGSLAVFGPGDRLTFLATNPPGYTSSKRGAPFAASDGTFWVACGGSPCVTHDQGRTWDTRPVGVDWVATADGQTVFAGAHDDAGARLMRSTDAGLTWKPVPGITLRAGTGFALPNGDLLMVEASEEGGVYRLKPGATTLDKVTGAPAHPAVLYLTGGLLVAAGAWAEDNQPNLPSLISISPDYGATWRAAPPPVA